MRAANGARRLKLLFVVTEDWYFCSHRLPLALAAMEAGMDVSIATNVTSHGDLIERAGISLHPWRLRRGSTGLWGELMSLLALVRIYRRVRPDIVHQVAIKPVLYGSVAARLTGVPSVVNALGGMGFVFGGEGGARRWLRPLILAGFRFLLGGAGKLLILQNPDDRALVLEGAGLAAEGIRLVRGAGVNVAQYGPSSEPGGIPLVLLPARMLYDKGIAEFVAAAALLKKAGVVARFALVGAADPCNPASIAHHQLEEWVATGAVEWLGRRDDMPALFAQSALVCLPSYREGLPKALLEAASSARAIVSTDVPGCREIVRDGENGLLVPAKNVDALAAALGALLADPQRRARMGQRGRQMVLDEFSEQAVVSATMSIYRELMAQAA